MALLLGKDIASNGHLIEQGNELIVAYQGGLTR